MGEKNGWRRYRTPNLEGADHFYELSLNVGYQWSDAIGTALGYRMFDVDYEDDGFVYDVRQQGWQLGLTWAF